MDTCLACESCVDTGATASCSATANDHQDCDSGDPYWYDSCDVQGSRVDECTGGEVCVDIGATASCVCETNDHQDCSGGHPYWYDSCDVQGSRVDTCESCESCVDAGATASCSPTTTNDHQDCSGGHPFWYDSCGVQGSRVETCETYEPCVDSGETAFCIDFVEIPAGTFCMGSPDGSTECMSETPPSEGGRDGVETLHEVTLTRGFFLQQTEVTQRQWTALGFTNPSYLNECGLDCPVETVNWWEAVAYVNALSELEELTPCYTLEGCDPSSAGTDIACTGITVSDPDASGNPYLCEGYRLPMEAEWEYAYRAGTRTAFYNGGITNTERTPLDENLDLIGWYGGNSGVSYVSDYDCTGWYDGSDICGTHAVGGKDPNAWALYDMAGNVWEWVFDSDGSAYSPDPAENPVSPNTGSNRVFRGGSFSHSAQFCRAAYRAQNVPSFRGYNVGFRPSRSALP